MPGAANMGRSAVAALIAAALAVPTAVAQVPARSLADAPRADTSAPVLTPPSSEPAGHRATSAVHIPDTCPAVRAELPALAEKGVKFTWCSGPGHLSPATLRRMLPATVPANPAARAAATNTPWTEPPPSWCAISGTYYYMYREEACGVFDRTDYLVSVPDGKIKGRLTYDYVSYAYTSSDLNAFAYVVRWRGVARTGAARWGMYVAGHPTCRRPCEVTSHKFPRQLVRDSHEAAAVSFNRTTRTARGDISDNVPIMHWHFDKAGYPPSNPVTASPPALRCDNALPGANNVGCVFAGYWPWMVYYRSADPALARHIALAERSGLPGGTGSRDAPVHRTWPHAITRNRRASCPWRKFPRPAGYQCDEYPFASTREGAAKHPRERRTFRRCHIHRAPIGVTGPRGYSICMIPGKQNEEGGRELHAFYRFARVLPGDAFRVEVRR